MFGLNFLGWFFPIGSIVALFGFVTVWATLGFKWAFKIVLFGFIPTIIDMIWYTVYTMQPIFLEFFNALQTCGNEVTRAAMNQCINSNLNLTSIVNSIPAAPTPPFQLPPIAIPFLIGLNVLMLYFVFVKRVLKIKNRIKRTLGGLYGFGRKA